MSSISPDAAIEFRAVRKSYGSINVLNGIDLVVERGKVVVICGPSGSGKSTLIRLINGLETITNGEIFVAGAPISGLRGKSLQALRTGIGFVFQQFNLYAHLTAEENITLALRKIGKLSREAAHGRATNLLERVGIGEKAGAYPHELSGGQQQRVAIARALGLGPQILLFDEPTSALDPEMIGEVLAVMRELAQTGITMVVVTHEMGFARELADQIVFLDGGRVAENATPDAFFAPSAPPRIRRFIGQILSPLHQAEP
jgi:polar amino acid transport system ATP-binding protein